MERKGSLEMQNESTTKGEKGKGEKGEGEKERAWNNKCGIQGKGGKGVKGLGFITETQ